MKAVDKLIAALRSTPDGRGWIRGLRARLVRYGIPTVIDDGGRKVRQRLVIRHAASPAEGAAGLLVAELQRTENGATTARVIATEDGAVRAQQSSSGRAAKVRPVRLDDETWARCQAEGNASAVIRTALDEYFSRRAK